MPLTDILLLLACLAIFIIVVGSIWRYISGEIDYYRWKKKHERED